MTFNKEETSSSDDYSSSSSSMQVDDDQLEGDDVQLQNQDDAMKVIQSNAANSIHEQALMIIEKMNTYSDISKSSSEMKNKDPTKMYDSIEQSTNTMVNTWSEYYSQLEELNMKIEKDKDEETFRKVYMDMITKAFADELDDLRHGRVKDKGKKKKKKAMEGEEVLKQHNVIVPNINKEEILKGDDVKVLVSCLESGMDIWTDDEKRFLISKKESQKTNTKSDEKVITLHERRRRALFGI
jgi:ABC-type transporter MlaC component